VRLEVPGAVPSDHLPHNDPAALSAGYRLADYPVLALLARDRTEATRLDGRACLAIYESAPQGIDWSAVSADEKALMRLLGLCLSG
jgi:hypothetical protein